MRRRWRIGLKGLKVMGSLWEIGVGYSDTFLYDAAFDGTS
jgi:hypothetical protein